MMIHPQCWPRILKCCPRAPHQQNPALRLIQYINCSRISIQLICTL